MYAKGTKGVLELFSVTSKLSNVSKITNPTSLLFLFDIKEKRKPFQSVKNFT